MYAWGKRDGRGHHETIAAAKGSSTDKGSRQGKNREKRSRGKVKRAFLQRKPAAGGGSPRYFDVSIKKERGSTERPPFWRRAKGKCSSGAFTPTEKRPINPIKKEKTGQKKKKGG